MLGNQNFHKKLKKEKKKLLQKLQKIVPKTHVYFLLKLG
jgi:hypothetical protein